MLSDSCLGSTRPRWRRQSRAKRMHLAPMSHGGRHDTESLAECGDEVAQRPEPQLVARERYRGALVEHPRGVTEPHTSEVPVWRHTHESLEYAREVERAEPRGRCEVAQRERARVLGLDQLHCAFDTPHEGREL